MRQVRLSSPNRYPQFRKNEFVIPGCPLSATPYVREGPATGKFCTAVHGLRPRAVRASSSARLWAHTWANERVVSRLVHPAKIGAAVARSAAHGQSPSCMGIRSAAGDKNNSVQRAEVSAFDRRGSHCGERFDACDRACQAEIFGQRAAGLWLSFEDSACSSLA